MPGIDPWAGDGYTMVALTRALNKIPGTPLQIGSLGVFEPFPIATKTVAVEESQGKLTLIPTTKRGGPGIPSEPEKRVMTNFNTAHWQLDSTVFADDHVGVRAFGSDAPESGLDPVVARKLETDRRSHDATVEYMRLAALRGHVTYPTNSVDADVDVHSVFGTSEQTQTWAYLTQTTHILETVLEEVRDKIETALGGTPYSGIVTLAGRTAFRAITSHDLIRAFYNQQQSLFTLNQSVRGPDKRRRFDFEDHSIIEYYGPDAASLLDADHLISFPIGVPGLYADVIAPGDYEECIGTLGLEMYAKQWAHADGKGRELQTQTNRLEICTRPRCLIYGANA